VLGICYGYQLMAHLTGGEVIRATRREYGRTDLVLDDVTDLFSALGPRQIVWMSHGDVVHRLPDGFEPLAHTTNTPFAAAADRRRRLYGVQFHIEVVHTPNGLEVFRNFLYKICGCDENWSMTSFIEDSVANIRAAVGAQRVICGLSGGVDSSTTAALVHRAVGDHLTCIFVNHGLLRNGEPEQVLDVFRNRMQMRLLYVDATERFLSKLVGVVEPEVKRKVIGEAFIRVFEEEAKQLGDVPWLAQGTLYPDVVESARSGGPASRIKAHHNVAGLPSGMAFKLLEPLRWLYKDEVRQIARALGVPTEIVTRHPFPGPGLAVRIMGEVTPEKLHICRASSQIVEDELTTAGLYERVWQAFAVVGDDRWVGVKGDERQLGRIVILRIVESVDAMTADWPTVPRDVIERISSRITNEVPNVTLVAMAVSSKPPSTIEPC
jgi:GMP synthase (glutamine-hydrolysing)